MTTRVAGLYRDLSITLAELSLGVMLSSGATRRKKSCKRPPNTRKAEHGMDTIPPNVLSKVRASIQDEEKPLSRAASAN
jgi:hypothetical protein